MMLSWTSVIRQSAAASHAVGRSSRVTAKALQLRRLQHGRLYSSTSSLSKQTVLVLGSSGALGSVVSKHLSSQEGMTVVGADVLEIPTAFTGDWEVSFVLVFEHAKYYTLVNVPSK
jgi:hypothetical protein